MENNGQQPKKVVSKKVSTILLIIGFPLVILGVYLLISNFANFSTGSTFLFLLSPFIIVAGAICIRVGLLPYITKVGAKLGNETLDYAGKDLSSMGSKMADVATPAIKKTTETIASAIKGAKAKNTCPYCGDEVDDDEEFCESCGKPLKKVCRHCGKSNNAKSKFCKYCGKEL